jgi:hypothetical protein
MRLFWFIALAGLASGAETFTGVITDTMCGAKHTMMRNQADDKCVAMCTKGSSEFALYDGKTVMKLSDQKTPGKFAAQRVKVTGTYDGKSKSIKVSAIEADKGENQ